MEMTSQTEPLLNDSNESSSESDINTVITLCMTNMIQASAFGVISPFFPSEAAKKGVSTVVIGFIFGTYELVEFLASPIFGSIIVKVGARNMYLLGSFLLGGSSLAFGVVIIVELYTAAGGGHMETVKCILDSLPATDLCKLLSIQKGDGNTLYT
ncbi:SLC18B1 [Bugula neritina]|uniref:SLC18B1 n=1 Tax=Bugula neritina TaxID=10212 RepID=A0A7J7KFX2_BUGNE|nr:SLC18B1 [Bugula neritina]